MTNQEAIELLKIERDHMTPTVFTERVEAMDMAISALQAQEAKTQLSAEGTTSDLISRQDAIEVIEEMQMPIMRSMFPEEQFVFKGMSEALSAIKDLPSAQPEIEERTEEFAQNVPKEDLISRKAAIDALGKRPMVWTDDDQYALGERNQYDIDRLAIETLPSAQPEPQWIPVSKRLPEEGQSILVTANGWHMVAIIRTFFKDIHKDIIAWMPLPEPYREERRTDDLQ